MSSLLKITIIQKRALTCILGTQYNSYNYNKLHSTFNILKFSDIVKYNTAKFMNRAINKMLPINLQKLYKIKTYNKNLFYRIKVRTDRKAFCLTNVGPQLWNNLNINLKYNNNQNKFNKNYKKYLISLYKD